MSLPWTLSGAALGALTALGFWYVDSPDQGRAEGARAAERGGEASPDGALRAAPRPSALPADTSQRQATPSAAAAVELDPLFGVIAFGRVTGSDGATLRARVALEDEAADLSTAYAAADGTWSLIGLHPGPQDLSISAQGYLPLEESIELPNASHWRRDVVLEVAPSFPVRFESPSGEALVVPRFSGELAAYLAVVATEETPPPVLPAMVYRSASRFGVGTFASRHEQDVPADLGERYQGLLRLEAAPPLVASLVLRDVVLESRALRGDESELVFVVDPDHLSMLSGEVRVRVVNGHTGEVVEGVELDHPSGGMPIRARLDGDQWVFEDVPPGRLDLMAGGFGGGGPVERLEREVHVPPEGLVDLGTIELNPSITLKVRTVDTSGSPLPLSIRAVRPDLVGGAQDLDLRIGSRADADGVTAITWLGAGRTLLRAGGRDGWAAVAREVDARDGLEVELVVARGVDVVVLGPLDPDEAFSIEDGAGLTLLAGRSLRRETCLVPGRYTLVIEHADGSATRQAFDVGNERTVVRRSAR